MDLLKPSRRKIVLALSAVMLLSAAMPAVSALRRGSIRFIEPVAGAVVSGEESPIAWNWRTGRLITSSSVVDVLVSSDGIWWNLIGSEVSVRNGEVLWDTTTYSDGEYDLEIVVADSTLRARTEVLVDNTAPEVRIERPAVGDVIVEDQNVARVSIVAGRTTLVAAASDDTSGIETVTWLLDGERIAEGETAEYVFGTQPGRHTLTAVAADLGGNTAEHEIEIHTVPGPSSTTGPLQDAPDAPEAPTPDPSGAPVAPEVPAVPSDVPTPPPSDQPEPPTLPDAPEVPPVP